jgi:curved DNA-binding protein CbpA
MPPQWLNGWISVRSTEKFSYVYGTDEMADKLFATNDATWTDIVSVNFDYLEGFMKGRAIALSFDLTLLSEEIFEKLKNYISEFKNERDFWKNAVCYILVDTKTMLALEFRNADFSKIEIVVFSGKSKQDNICIYPVLDKDAEYEIDGSNLTKEVEITPPEAVLGTNKEIKTLHGNINIKIPAGVSTGKMLRLKNLGLPKDKGFGDLNAKIKIVIPKNYNDEVKKLYNTLNDKAIEFKDFKCKLSGYIHYIDYDKYKDKSYFDNYRTQEFVIKGDVKPFKIDKVSMSVNMHYWNGER